MDWQGLLPVIVSAILGWFLRHRGVGATWFGGAPSAPSTPPVAPVAPLDDVARALEEDRRRHVERQQRRMIDALREEQPKP